MKPAELIPMLMFEGVAEEAMNLYVGTLGGEVLSVTRYLDGEPGARGSIKQATFAVCGQKLMCMDSPVKHGFTFTPSLSLFVTCPSEAVLREAVEVLGRDGQALMPLGHYGFSRLFAWVNDRYGVSWQLNLP